MVCVCGSYLHEERSEVAWTNLAKAPLLNDAGEQITTLGGRPLYVSWDPLAGDRPDTIGGSNTDRYDILLTNVSGGRSIVSTFSLGNNWDNGLSVRLATLIKMLKTSHRWFIYCALELQLPNSCDKKPARGWLARHTKSNIVLMSVTTAKSFPRLPFKLLAYSGIVLLVVHIAYAYTFRFRGFGDGSQNNLWSSTNYTLPYIPSGADDPNVRYTGGLTYAQFAEWIQSANLEQFAGGYAVRNEGNRGPWNTNLDFRFEQETVVSWKAIKALSTLISVTC